MENLTTEQWMKKYPYLRRLEENTIFTTADDIKNMENGEKISVNGEEVVVEFLKRIIQDSNYYNYARRFLNNEILSFRVCHIINGDTCGIISYGKTTLVEGLEQLINAEKLILKPEERQRYETLKNSISFERFLERINGNNYNIEIDGNKYSISIERMVSLMQMPEVDFDKLCNSPEITNIDGIPKEHFIYALYNYFEENNVFTEFMIPQNIKTRFNDIQSFQKIDIQALNKFLKTRDTMFKNVQIVPELKRAILAGIPEDSTQLEKAVYIYIKMCKLLTYDDEYYAVNQKGPATEKHKDHNYVSTINLTNNRVVCFEFNLIYSKLLDELGIKFKSTYKNMIGEVYGAGHTNLIFRSGKFLVKADSVTSIFQGDIMRSKLNQPLVGLRCINKNQNTQQEFKNVVTKMYELIAQQEADEVKQVEHIESFEEIMTEYKRVAANIGNVSLDEKVSILIDKVNSTKMIGIDSLSYILQLKKILFNDLERTNNAGISVIRSNDTIDPNKIAMTCAIISLNKEGFEIAPDQTLYFYYSPNSELVPISKEELQLKFENEIFGYIENDNPRIPGIIEVGGIKK